MVFFQFFCGLAVLLTITGTSFAQKQTRALTILYTNNINGETDPCPT